MVGSATGFIALLPTPLSSFAATALLLVVAICVFTFRPPQTEQSASLSRCALVVLAAAVCASLTWAYFDNAEQRALESRAAQLDAQVWQPGSPLACLNALTGDSIDAACEKALFASPANVAAAISFVAARFGLLVDMTAYTAHGGVGIDSAMMPLRRVLEADPYGVLAHVLAVRDGCTGGTCPQLQVLRDASHVRTNLVAQTLDHYVERYRTAWATVPDAPLTGPVAEVQPAPPPLAGVVAAPKPRVSGDFPSAASIPPISIMNPEPKAPPAAPGPRAAEGAAKPPPSGIPPYLTAPSPQSEPVWLPPSTQAGPPAQATQ